MRKLELALAAILCVAAAAPAQTQYEGPWANKLFQNKTTLDFGNVARGTQLKHSFPIKNIWGVPLEITISKVTCGCLTASLSKKTLQPLEEGTLDVVMDAGRFNGHKSIAVYVTVGPQYVSTAVVNVSANARSDVAITPGEINFGVVPQGQQPVQSVDIEYAGFLDWQVKEVVKPADAPISVTMEETTRRRPTGNQSGKVSYRLTVKLNPDAPSGALKHDLVLKTNDPVSESLIVTVDANIQAALRVVPNQVNLGTLKLGETKTFKVQVLGARPFRITEFKADGQEISAELPAQAQTNHMLTLRCQPQALGELKRTVTLITDLDNNATVTVTIQATAGQ